MPYIITTNRPIREWIDDAWRETTCGRTTRRAVATLEEARDAVHRDAHTAFGGKKATDTVDRRAALNAALSLPASGGTIGPLPDGTVIEVTRMSWTPLAQNAGLKRRQGRTDAEILDAYNARGVR